MNELGLNYLEDNIPVALVVFKMNIELFPYSYITYDSYGYALRKDNQQEEAIENYKK